MKHTKSKKSKRLSLRKLIKGGFQNAGSPASEHVNTLLKADCAPLNIGSITPKTGTDVSNVNIWKTTGGGYKKSAKGGSPASNHVNTLLKADCAPLNIGSITPETGADVSNVNIWKTTGGGYKKKRKKSKRKNKNKNKNKKRKKSNKRKQKK